MTKYLKTDLFHQCGTTAPMIASSDTEFIGCERASARGASYVLGLPYLWAFRRRNAAAPGYPTTGKMPYWFAIRFLKMGSRFVLSISAAPVSTNTGNGEFGSRK